MGLTYANAASDRFVAAWHPWDVMGAIGGIIMFIACLFFFINFFAALFAKPHEGPGTVCFPTAEAYHDEQISWVRNFKPWIVVMILAVLLAYVPPLYQVINGSQEKAVPYYPWSPAPEK